MLPAVLPPAFVQKLLQKSLALSAAAQCLQRIGGDKDNLDGFAIVQPNQMIAFLNLVAPANWHGDDRLPATGDCRLH